ncbi:hypothetical protein Xinn_04160 [Xenorhabdus innexi]|uniref:Uncharacterized protein n=1 Tax=Xenorhabdus innexi TaxID=290109 RepID=A0A2G0MIF0_9GAMM|nr:hypothetical protein Xinn_04160 [Xenorhabdus innexi]
MGFTAAAALGRLRAGPDGPVTQYADHGVGGFPRRAEFTAGTAFTLKGADGRLTQYRQLIHHIKTGADQIAGRPDGSLSLPALPLPANPRMPAGTGGFAAGIIHPHGIPVPAVHQRFVFLQSRRLRPFAVLRKIHHLIGHRPAVELGFIKGHTGLQHPVGQHVIQSRISPLDNHRRQTGNGACRPLNDITHQVLKSGRYAVQLIADGGFQVKIAAHQIRAPAQL